MPDKPDGRRTSVLMVGAPRTSLCLDFANTLHWHASDNPRETLHGYADLLAWIAGHGAVSDAEVDALERRARREPQAAEAVYRRGLALREAIYRGFVACISGGAPAGDDLRVLNEELQRALPHYGVEFGTAGATWSVVTSCRELDLPLWPAAQAAAGLLLAEDLRTRVGQCADPAGCGWLFLDSSKNRSRRWCSIADCGNRAKQRRLQARLKQAR